jgi:hypothetical protein
MSLSANIRRGWIEVIEDMRQKRNKPMRSAASLLAVRTLVIN